MLKIWHIEIRNRGLHYFVKAQDQKEAMDEVFGFAPDLIYKSLIMEVVGVVEVYDETEPVIVGYVDITE